MLRYTMVRKETVGVHEMIKSYSEHATPINHLEAMVDTTPAPIRYPALQAFISESDENIKLLQS